jgi:membrane protease YdiL (CAAX protease family)
MKRPRSAIWYGLNACTAFLISTYIGDLIKLAGLRRILHGWIWVGAVNLFQLIVCVAAVMAAHAVKLKAALAELGLRRPIGSAMAFSFAAASPMLLIFAATSSISTKMSVMSIGVGCFVAPFAEEVLFRGYMFAQLYRRARWGFWLSALIPSMLFAVGHAYQADGLWELVGIFAVTGLGSLLGCWIYMRWQFNLWTVFGLHCLMNLWWEVFGAADTALGGWSANGARLLTITIAILLTINKDRFWKPITADRSPVDPTNEQNLGDHTSDRNLANLEAPLLIRTVILRAS